MQAQQPQPAPAAGMPSKISEYKEHQLFKELMVSSADFKFTVQASQNKLTNIKLLSTWFAVITKMLERNGADIEQFLFGTAASLNEGKHLTLKTSTCKSEPGVKLEQPSGEKMELMDQIRHELEAWDEPVTTYKEFAAFLEASSYEMEIGADPDLRNLVSPSLFPRAAPTKILEGAKLFMSPQYQETITLGDKIGGKTRVSENTQFIFPSSVRIGTAKHVTFHYVRGQQLPESRIHQMLRPHLWRWLGIAVSDGPFTHLLNDTWEGDHTDLFQKLIALQNSQREETDQVFAIFNCQMELCKKPKKESLMTWYIKALKDVDIVNAVTSTYKESCSLTMISTGMVDSMYMVHAHGMGYDKLMTKISREFEGYVPIKELQRRIALDVESDNRSQAFTDFTTKNAHVFGEEKQPRRERQANAASGRAPRDRSKPQSSQATPSGGGTGKALTGTDRVNVCHNFLMDKCDYGKECKFEHRKIKVPGAACSKFLQGNT